MSKKISRRNRRIRNLLLVISMMMVVAMASVGVTVAWLTDATTAITNTFTAGNIDITLSESASATNYKMVPGSSVAKDPKVTVEGGSEDCWLFVKLTKSTTTDSSKAAFDDYMTYTIADGWQELTTGSGVYYREVAANADDQTFEVLSGNQVTVKSEVTKAQMDAISKIGDVDNTSKRPTLTVQAYACQKANISAPADNSKTVQAVAWEYAQTATVPTT